MLFAALFALGCGTDVVVSKDPDSVSAQVRLGLTDAQASALIAFLNDCATTYELLDLTVALDADAADALVAHRDGPDGACDTGDDEPYVTVDDVADVPQVGDRTILAVVEYLERGGGSEVQEGTYDGVSFTAAEASVVLEIANRASLDTLDVAVGLDADAAANIVDARPIADMAALAAVPEVGGSSMQKLKDYIAEWDGR
jgi:DNA uptake protein ComE-like DNA-binding protein